MQNIFLIGLSGSGKSSVGRMLAQRLGRPLFDIDQLIEEDCGKPIPSIFARHGEDYFRNCESRLLASAVGQSNADGAVIATGGGIVLRPENRRLMADRGIRVFLSTEPATAFKRLAAPIEVNEERNAELQSRPLLAGPQPLVRLQTLLTERAAWYAEAEISCSTEGKTAEEVARQVIATLVGAGEIDGVAPIVRHVHVGQGYDTIVDWGGLGRLAQYLAQLQLPLRLFLVTDSTVAELYTQPLLKQLIQAGFEPQLYRVPAGEASKSQSQLSGLYDWLIGQHAERREAIIALGGGMIGDLVGYAAATYLRGVPLVQVPTSLLAQVDAAIGGKTGINHEQGKNLIGAFYHPRLVLADPATLLTLPKRERTEGWAEVVKYGMILDTELFGQLEAHADTLRDFTQPPATLLCQIIARCIALKASIVEEDEREQGRRAVLNYGHTLGHALENVAGYGTWLHGEAVSLGMVAAAAMAQQAGLFAADEMIRQNQLLAALGLPIAYSGAGSVRAQDVLAAIQLDKKVAAKRVRWIMPQRIGDVTITPMPDDLVRRVVEEFFM